MKPPFFPAAVTTSFLFVAGQALVAGHLLSASEVFAQPAPADGKLPAGPGPVPAPPKVDVALPAAPPPASAGASEKGTTEKEAGEKDELDEPEVSPAAPPAEGSSALVIPEEPPPPPPDAATKRRRIQPLPKAFADEAALAVRDSGTGEAVAGWHNRFFLRDPDGNFRISPIGEIHLDFNAWAGTGVSSVPTVAGGAGLPARFFARRVRFGVNGEFLKRWTYQTYFDIAQGLTNATGTEEAFAAPAGTDPTSDTARFRPVQGADAGVRLQDAWVNYSLCPCLNFQIGQFLPPVTMETRSSDSQALPLMDRSVATRSFTVPAGRETGLMIWGDFGDDMATYELAVLGGDGLNRATVDGAADFAGRLLVAPFKSFKLVKDIRFGLSARHGERDPAAVGYDITPFATTFGWTLWDPTYRNDENLRVHVMPSGAQNTIGGEFYVPIGPVDIAGQAYFNAYNTREAVEGYQFTNTERLGTLNGGAMTTWLTWWIFGDERVSGPVGRIKPFKLNLKKKAEAKRGMEATALFSAIVADYDGNSRGGEDDQRTPGSEGSPNTRITVYQISAGLSYWHTRSMRIMFNYNAFVTPGSGTGDNLAKVPGNVGSAPDALADAVHEFGTRLQLGY